MYKQDLALNNHQRLICYKTQPTKLPPTYRCIIAPKRRSYGITYLKLNILHKRRKKMNRKLEDFTLESMFFPFVGKYINFLSACFDF